MQVVIPIPFNASQLVSSNAIEEYAAWSGLVTYSKDDRVDYGTEIWQSLINSNSGAQPDISPTAWIKVGPDNTHAMFDLQVSTQTVSSSPLSVVVVPGKKFNTLAGINVTATSATLTVKDTTGGTEIYNQTLDLDRSDVIVDYYGYFFDEFIYASEFVFTNIPPYDTSEFTLSLLGTGEVKIGQVLYGNSLYLGDTQYGINSGIRDFSVKQIDEFGETVFIQRGFSKRFEANLMVKNSSISYLQQTLQNLRASPVLWIPSTDSKYSSLNTFGYYKEFDINIPYPDYSMCSIQVEGLI